MVQASVDGTVIADSASTVFLENNHYFPSESMKTELFSDSATKYTCPWKGHADYYNASINGKEIKDIAWYYPDPKEKAKHIKNYVAFDKGKVSIA